MKTNLVIYFDYDDNDDEFKDQKVSSLLMNFGEFCDNTSFEFQSIPHVGEYIKAEPLLKKWIESKEYPKSYSDEELFNMVFKVLRMGYFMVEEVYHGLDVCTIHCSDVDYDFLKK